MRRRNKNKLRSKNNLSLFQNFNQLKPKRLANLLWLKTKLLQFNRKKIKSLISQRSQIQLCRIKPNRLLLLSHSLKRAIRMFIQLVLEMKKRKSLKKRTQKWMKIWNKRRTMRLKARRVSLVNLRLMIRNHKLLLKPKISWILLKLL